ncbi:MAG: DUF1501 domain-containing protein [Limisphaerales bacterium]
MNPIVRTRREFLRTTVLGAALAGTAPAFLTRTWAVLDAQARDAAIQATTGRDGPILVVLQMAGGNDGLNTVVPSQNDHYRRARRRLGLPDKDLLKLGGDLSWHPALQGFRKLAEAGHLSVVQGVGYPNPNRSHFRSTEIWQTAADSNRVVREGWIGRYFDHECDGCDPTVGVSIGRQMPQAFTARVPTGITLAGPARNRGTGSPRAGGKMGMEGMVEDSGASEAAGGTIDALSGGSATSGSVLDYLDRTAMDAQVSSAKVREILARAETGAAYPGNGLAQSLKTVARLIAGGLLTRIYYLSQGGYDTHRDQLGTHARLLGELGDSVNAFIEDLKAQGQLERVLLMTFSEFGRRVGENASGGTDHGAAGPMFLAGAKLPTLLHGRYPSLAPGDLLNGDLRFEVDFRRVYASVLENWLKVPSQKILGGRFQPMAGLV